MRTWVAALAALACCCVFAALAGPAASLRLRTEALHQTLGAQGSASTSVQVRADWQTYTQQSGGSLQSTMSDQDLADATAELGRGLAGTPLPLVPGAWGGLTTGLYRVSAGAAGVPSGVIPQLELTAREPLSASTRVVAGTMTAAPSLNGTISVVVTEQTAARFGWHPGTSVTLSVPSGPVRLLVTGIVTPRDAASSFWTVDVLAPAPSLDIEPQQEFLDAAAFADPGQLPVIQGAFCHYGGYCGSMQLLWEFPVATGPVNADQASGLYAELGQAAAVSPAMSAAMPDAATTLTITSPLTSVLAGFLTTQTAVLSLLMLLFGSLIAVGAAVICLAARMIVAQREDELMTRRARGASVAQIAGTLLRGVAPAAGPAAAAGAIAAIALVPGAGTAGGGSATLGWAMAASTLAVALCGPALIAAWRVRAAAPAVNPARVLSADVRTGRPALLSGPALRRVTAEVTGCAAAVAGLAVLRGQGVQAAGTINWYLTVAPVLAAVPAAVIMLRLYPVVIRLLARLAARRAGATGYLALAGSAGTSLATALPAFTLILALTLATFGGMIRDAVGSGQAATAWQTTGADAVITTNAAEYPITPALTAEVAAVPGVQRVAPVWHTTWATPGGAQLSIDAVGPAQYAALTAATPFPRIQVAALRGGAGVVIPVLASPSAAASLGKGVVRLTGQQLGPVSVRVAGTLASTPAEPAGGAFLLMATRQVPGGLGHPVPDMLLVSGSGIDQPRLTAIVSRRLPTATLTYRADVLAALRNAPLPSAAESMLLPGVLAAGGFGLLNLALGLALGARDRELTLARLSVLGHERAVRLVLLEALPAVLAAIAAATACALLLPALTANALDLSVFTGSGAPVRMAPDLAVLGLEAGAVAVLAGVALVLETGRARRRGVGGLLRTD